MWKPKNNVNVLGTEYKIIVDRYEDDPTYKDEGWAGYISHNLNEVHLLDLDTSSEWKTESDLKKEIYSKETLRHEITHAFFNESGLRANSFTWAGAWARNEEMVDWFAIQSPKIFKVFQELELI